MLNKTVLSVTTVSLQNYVLTNNDHVPPYQGFAVRPDPFFLFCGLLADGSTGGYLAHETRYEWVHQWRADEIMKADRDCIAQELSQSKKGSKGIVSSAFSELDIVVV
jgi:hypothetical protein